MQAEFWHERWQKNEIAFHQADVNAWLTQYWPALNLPPHSRVFVPLCGKSLDLRWLASQGHDVIGVELSEMACRAFFDEAGLVYTETDDIRFKRFSAGPYQLLCGDFFALTTTDLSDVVAVYDRASLVALPPEMRRDYARCLIQRLPQHTSMLLLTFDYDQTKMPGPPHAVSIAEVHELYDVAFTVDVLLETPDTEPPPPFKARGLTWLREAVMRLTRG